MIRINLVGAPKTKKGGKRAAASVSGGESSGLGVLLILVIVLLIAAAGNGAYYLRLKHESEKISSDMKKAESDYARLTQVKMKYQEREKQREAYKRRVDVIDQLRASQAGPVNLLSMLGDTVSNTDAIWLTTMTDDGSNINLKGVALSVHAVADLMHNLETTGYFKQVDIKTSTQNEKFKDMQAFDFELTCTKQQTTTAATAPAEAKPGKPQPKKS
ncbi:MAG: PilN domain-containing protein [Terriglobales bacterium]